MVFKRSAILLAAVAAAALASTEAAAPIEVQTSLKHPVVKSATHANGKLTLTLVEDPKKAHHAKKHHEVKKPEVKKVEAKKVEHKKVEVKKTEAKKPATKKHHEVKKPAAHKQVSQTKDDKEVVKKYPHGQVHIAAKGVSTDAAKPAAKKHHHKKVAKQEATEPVEEETDATEEADVVEEEGSVEGEEPAAGDDDAVGSEGDDVTTDEQDFLLPVGDSVDITVEGETITLKHFANGSVVMYSTEGVQVINAKNIYLDFELDADESSASGSSDDNSTIAEPTADSSSEAEDNTLAGEIKKDVSVVAKKFSELATKLTGNGMKEAAPIIFIGGAIGALAAVVGIAAIAIGRARSNSAAADPASVLADATEDVEADVEAATEEKKDADAEESQALDSSDSESEADEEQEEGKFTNEVASV